MVKFQGVHIPGIQNVCADPLSRWGSTVNRWGKLPVQISHPIWLKAHEHMYIDTNI